MPTVHIPPAMVLVPIFILGAMSGFKRGWRDEAWTLSALLMTVLLATGIVSWIIFQALINIGGITRTIPFTGVPLPFISYGGTSLVVDLTALGILVNVSRQRVRARTGDPRAGGERGTRNGRANDASARDAAAGPRSALRAPRSTRG